MNNLRDWIAAAPAPDTFDPNRYSSDERKARSPYGQTLARKFPHLEYASIPHVENAADWTFTLDGEVEQVMRLTLEEWAALGPVSTHAQDFHCITGWSVLDTEWLGIKGSDLIARVRPAETVTSVMVYGLDEFSTSMWVQDFANSIVAFGYRGLPLSPAHGFPLRLVAPAHLYQFKSCKWLTRVEFLTEHKLGFWEIRAYSDSALVAENDRYANPTAAVGKTIGQIRANALEADRLRTCGSYRDET